MLYTARASWDIRFGSFQISSLSSPTWIGVQKNVTLPTDPHKNRSIIKPATATKGKAMMNVNARTSAANNLASGMRGNVLALKATVDGEFMLSFL
jgi:hypothetical protein